MILNRGEILPVIYLPNFSALAIVKGSKVLCTKDSPRYIAHYEEINDSPELIYTDTVISDFYKCPYCKQVEIERHYNYCPMCSEKIFWDTTKK